MRIIRGRWCIGRYRPITFRKKGGDTDRSRKKGFIRMKHNWRKEDLIIRNRDEGKTDKKITKVAYRQFKQHIWLNPS